MRTSIIFGLLMVAGAINADFTFAISRQIAEVLVLSFCVVLDFIDFMRNHNK